MTAPLSLKTARFPCVLLLSLQAIASAASVTEPSTGITVTVNPAGDYLVESANPPFRFGGNLDTALSGLTSGAGTDNLGLYQEIAFQYTSNGARSARMRTYAGKPVVLFSVRYMEAAPNLAHFPSLTTYPRNMSHLTYDGIFGNYRFDLMSADSPWVYFDGSSRTFILSPASHLDTAITALRAGSIIESGVDPSIAALPQDFRFDTILVMGQGINATFDVWGRALTDLGGKTRPASDADAMLSRLGYWTDHGASYYYEWERGFDYAGTLQRVKEEFDRQGAPLGYMQLDSWFYPKGPAAKWEEWAGGTYNFEADSRLFPQSLASFQDKLGIPLVAHGRWIDAGSPYRAQYKMSNNVVVDRRYWEALGDYFRASGVVSYEQDWLGGMAQANLNLNDRDQFLGDMAGADMQRKITIQYCMPLPRHYMQSTRFDNVTTIRTSDDRFTRDRWDQFLFASRLASAVGLWPWSDVFMSYEPDNLLLATLSAGPVGVGDRIANINGDNLLRAVRADGVIVKPDAPIVPVDEMYSSDAQGNGQPMVASTYTAFEQSRALYVFAYQRSSDDNVGFTPAALGLPGPVYVYDYFAGTGRLVDSAGTYQDTVADRGYYIVAPVGPSGIAFLGDTGHFVSLGRKRITGFKDDGAVEATVAFAAGEKSRTLFGYSPSQPVVTALKGAADAVSYDESSHLFRVEVSPDLDGSAVITIQ